jgi:hypothetical protein
LTEAHRERLRGGHGIAGEQELLRARRPEHERPDRGAAVARDDAHAHMGIGDRRGVGHEDHVAQERERRAEPDRRAVQRGDDRQLDVEQVPDHLLPVAAQVLELLEVVERREPAEVAPGAERAPAPGEQHRPRGVLALELAKQPRELLVQQAVDRVELAGRVRDHHAQHVAHAVELQGAEAVHRSRSPSHRFPEFNSRNSDIRKLRR